MCIIDNKTFWKTVKPLFKDNIYKQNLKLHLLPKKNLSRERKEQIISEKVISEGQAVAEVFNKIFIH